MEEVLIFITPTILPATVVAAVQEGPARKTKDIPVKLEKIPEKWGDSYLRKWIISRF